jgi:hypothetical protein
VAVKLAVVAPAATVKLAGTVTEALLLERVTAMPPVGAAAFSVTVQLSVPAPEMDAFVQLRALNAAAGDRVNSKDFETLPAVAVRVALCVVVTEATVAVKLAVVAPAATVTLTGTVTEALLLERVTAMPPVGAAAFSVTVQLSVPAPEMDAFVQLRALNAAAGDRVNAKVFETLPAVAVRVTF